VELEFLGTAGAIPTPKPLCRCAVCAEARERGVPYSRSGPGLFVHGPDLLIDTSEDIREQLARSRVERIAACVYSHWHPDHTMGRRIFETMNLDWYSWPRRAERTRVYLPEQVAIDFRRWIGNREHFEFLEHIGVVELVELRDGESIVLGETTIRPFRVAEDYVYALLLEEGERRVLVAMDELKGWTPPRDLGRLDLAVLPMGICELDPRTGERRIPAEHPVLRAECTFAETLEILDGLDAERIVLSHVEEPDCLGHDDLVRLAERLRREGRPVTFAHDTLVVSV
jgi:phosphoribosyl 1,2-cyclic phosphate phosphodiesterase